jgi:hypothetical protein
MDVPPAIFVLIPMLLATGCGEPQPDPHDRVIHYQQGQSESELIRDVGPPTHARLTEENARGLLLWRAVERQGVRANNNEVNGAGA